MKHVVQIRKSRLKLSYFTWERFFFKSKMKNSQLYPVDSREVFLTNTTYYIFNQLTLLYSIKERSLKMP